MACDCIDTISPQLGDHRFDVAIVHDREANALVSRTYTRLMRRDNDRVEARRNQPTMMAHTFCPFCGTRYAPEPVTAPGEAA